MQVFCSRKWLYALEKSDLQSIAQSAAEFHDRNLPEIEHVLFLPVFCTRKIASETPFTPANFLAQEACDRNLRQKLASLNIRPSANQKALAEFEPTSYCFYLNPNL